MDGRGRGGSEGGRCYAFVHSKVERVGGRGRQTGSCWRLGMAGVYCAYSKAAWRGCAVVVGRCMGRVGLFLGAKSCSVC